MFWLQHNIMINMGITKSKGHKEKNDKFYTKKNISKQCIDLLNLSDFDIIVEPSAGNGSFSKQIKNCIAYDLVPEDDSIIKQDFFELDIKQFEGKKVLTIGNPPFGIQNNLAIKFFNKAAKYSDTIAFILPKTFMKKSIQNKLDLRFHLEKCIELPYKSFMLNGEDYGVNCIFQIWKIKNTKRIINNKNIVENYILFGNEKDFDFIIRRVGGNAGKAYILNEGEKVSTQSNYFIKNNSILTDEILIDIINDIKMDIVNYSVGPRSISKKELIEYIEEGVKNNTERQKSGFDFEKIVEKIFKHIKLGKFKNKYTSEYDAELLYKNEYFPCQIKHTTQQDKKYIELADLGRNYRKQDCYYLINGFDTNCDSSEIKIHFKNYTRIISNNLGINLSDIYVYYIKPEELNINFSTIEEFYNSNVNNIYTQCMDIDKGLCNFNDKTIFKNGSKTSYKTISKLYLKKDILSRYNFFDKLDKNLYNNRRGFVVYEPKEGFVTHIPVNDNCEPYNDVNDIPNEFSAILKIDNTLLTDYNWNIIRSYIKSDFDKNNIVKLNIKRDHKKQFRFQCSIETKYIEKYICEYNEDKFELNHLLKNIKTFNEFEQSLW